MPFLQANGSGMDVLYLQHFVILILTILRRNRKYDSRRGTKGLMHLEYATLCIYVTNSWNLKWYSNVDILPNKVFEDFSIKYLKSRNKISSILEKKNPARTKLVMEGNNLVINDILSLSNY